MELEDWDSSQIVDSFATRTGKYRDARNECLDVDESEISSEMDDYLLNMSRMDSSRGGSKDWIDCGKNVLSVKCTNSRDRITGTPSELVLKLNSEIASYLPHRRRILETGINEQVSKIYDENGETEPETGYEINYKRSECLAALVGEDEPAVCDEESLEYRCPGTMDILSRRMVPCNVAPTLREIALGRRMRRTVVDAPECLPADDTKVMQQPSETRENISTDEKRKGVSQTI